MKKTITAILCVMFVCALVSLTACSKGDVGPQGPKGDKGDAGENGIGIVAVEKTASENNIDVYKIKYSNGTESFFTVTNGKDGVNGTNGADGKDGKDGVGITDVTVNSSGEAVLTMSNGSSLNIGKIVGTNGKDGANGINGKDGVGIEIVTLDESGNLSVKLTSGTVLNLGNVKGADGKDGANGSDGKDGTNGTDGKDGVSVTKSEINEKGELVLTYSNGQSTNLGKVVGANGKDGTNGTNGTNGTDGADGKDGVGIQTVTIDGDGNLSVTYTNGEIAELGNIKGPKGDDGLSAFEIYKKYHPEYTGTEEEWLETLKGEKGDTGAAGVDGTDGTNGKDGTSVTDAYVDESLHLWIVLSDGTKIDAGYVGVETTNPEPEPEVTNPTIIVSSVTANAGETVDVTIALKNNPGVLGASFTLTYDSDLILTRAIEGEAWSTLMLTMPGVYTSSCNFGWDGVESDDSNGILLTLTFKVADDCVAGNYAIAITYTNGNIFDGDMMPVTFDIINGQITVY